LRPHPNETKRQATTGRLRWAWSLAGLLALLGPDALAYPKRLFATENACRADSQMSGDECRNAFANARAELDEAAPRFSRREECEKHFRRCMIVGLGGARGAEFGPTAKGVEIIIRSSSDKTARPVLEVESSAVVLNARTAMKPDTHFSAAARKKSQDAWSDWQRAQSAPVAVKPAQPVEPNDLGDFHYTPPETLQPEAPKLYPGDLERERRRREEIKNAPLVR
jgi:hypothetical protein